MPGSLPPVSIAVLSECAVIVQFESVIHPANLQQILSFQACLHENKFDGYIESVPSYSSLTVYFDPWLVSKSKLPGQSTTERVTGFLRSLEVKVDIEKGSVRHTVPVCYDLKLGVDLETLQKKLALSYEEIVKLHSSEEYTVYLIGFVPGFPYLGTLPASLECKRRESPRKKVDAGSVAIAGRQTGIYPFESPGGWQIIGRTPVKLFSIGREEPSLLKAGDCVKFEAISLKEFQRLSDP